MLVHERLLKVSDFTDWDTCPISDDDQGHLVHMLLQDRDNLPKGDKHNCKARNDNDMPNYPIKIAFRELHEALTTAHHFGKVPLVVCNGLDQPDRFLLYSCECVVDAKQLIAELYFHKTKTLIETREDLKRKLLSSMETHGVGLGLHLRM